MNDNSIEYAKMIEIPVCTYEYETRKKRKFFTKKNLINRATEDIESDKFAQNENLTDCETPAEFISETAKNEPTADDLVLKTDKSCDILNKTQRREKIKNGVYL